MIGLPAVLIHVLSLVGPIAVVIALIRDCVKKRRFPIVGIIWLPFVILLLCWTFSWNINHMHNRWILTNLDAEDVEELAIGT
ncbi:MAG: hypothetical protein KC994_26790, partial [Candidatus Omnitrophica bacterium]|nr:hypothetical protein [Candidatus Omnitrophota bacterium]